MDFPTFKIEQGGKNGRKKDPTRKTRVFETLLLGYLAADALWEGSRSGDLLRPVWLAYFGTERETHPFTANLRAGAKAVAGTTAVQFPKKAPLRWTIQKVPGGLVTVAYLPELFHLEPALPFAEDVCGFRRSRPPIPTEGGHPCRAQRRAGLVVDRSGRLDGADGHT